jgi:hypothetical protein
MEWMRRICVFLTLFFIMFFLLFSGISDVYASGVMSLDASNQNQDNIDNVFTFGELGYSERIMLSPYDSATMLFGLPPTWQLIEGGKIILRYNFSFNGANQSSLGGTLLIYFNSALVDTIYLNQVGEFVKEITIPVSALSNTSPDGRHYIGLFFDASINCSEQDVNSTLIVSASSEVVFAYTNTPPQIDLSKFPAPLYLPSSLVKIPATIVIPDQPSAVELQSALAVSAGLGSLTSGDFALDIVPVAKLSNEARIANNLIFVGLPANLPILQNALLPVPPVGSAIPINGIDVNDGIVQMALSPWNPTRVIVYVGGNSEQGLLKAASIIGSESIFTSGRPDIVIVSAVNTNTVSASIPDSRTLSDLGYPSATFGNDGGQYGAYSFYVSAEQSSSTGAYIDLVTSRSNLLDFEQSGISLALNGEIISTLSFSSDTPQVTTTRIDILPNILRRGNNTLEVLTSLRPKDGCYARDFENNWVTISDSSNIVTPSNTQKIDLSRNISLNNFPFFLLSSNNLSELAFVLPKDDSVSWAQASKIAYLLGGNTNLVIPDVSAYYADEIPEEILRNKDLIIIGRATTLAIMNEINNSLPAPFESGSDEAIQPAMLVNYRLIPGVSVGYLQLIPSPWNGDRTTLAVLGNTNEGIPMAGEALVNPDISSKLQGNFAIIYNNQVVSTDTRLGPSKESIIGELPIAVTVTPVQNEATTALPNTIPPAEVQSRAGWILPMLIVILLLALGIAFFVIRTRSLTQKVEKEIIKDNEPETE